MEDLFDTLTDFGPTFFRNIVSRRISEELFDDIAGSDKGLRNLAIRLEMRVKQHVPSDKVSRGFHYSTAVDHVFEGERFMESRFGDGTFPVLYGSVELETTVYETTYHFAKFVFASEGVGESVRQDRAAYDIECRALLIDLSRKQKTHPFLVSEDYRYTQDIARRVSSEGHPGLLAPSARCDGTNVVLFRRDVISGAGMHCYFTYTLDPVKLHVTVERQPGDVYLIVNVNSAR